MRSENVTANKEHASEVLPLLRNLEIERTWAGIMPFSRDGKPIIGKLEVGLLDSKLELNAFKNLPNYCL